MSNSIHSILTDPEALLKLSDERLKALLAPYIPDARKAILPEEKPSKIGVSARLLKEVMNDPTILAGLDAMRKAQK